MLKTKTKVTIGFVSILSVTAGILASNIVASQVKAASDSCTDTTAPISCSIPTTFEVNVVESLSVEVTTDSPASGNANTFLRNTVGLEVSTNGTAGFTASMYANNTSASNTASLLNTSDNTTEIATLNSNEIRKDFPSNYWGFSLEDYSKAVPGDTTTGDTIPGNDNGVYKSLLDSTSTSPITVLYNAGTANNANSASSQNIFFGAKADVTKPAGTYQGTVVLTVVSGVTPTPDPNPATDADTSTNNPAYEYNSTADATSFTYRSTNPSTGATTTSTTVSSGDNTGAYAPYAPAQGVTETTASSINSGAPLATGLAVTAAVAATSGAIFFILAKRKKDDDEEEEEEQV